jgi:hypothetical protein
MSRITQAFVGVRSFRYSFLDKYQLREYYRKDLPAVFFGCYTKQWHNIRAHQGELVVIWAGTDAYNLRFNPDFCKFLRENWFRIHHVAISRYIEEDLASVGLMFKSMPITPHGYAGFEPKPAGGSVYCYMPEVRQEFYGIDTLNKVKKLLPATPFIIANVNTYSRTKLIHSIYPSSFIGLRLTAHDGLSNSVVEMALMGRRSVSNAGYPGTIPWTTAESVAQAIEKEKSHPPNPQRVAKEMKRWLNHTPDWLMTESWENKKVDPKKLNNDLDEDLVSIIINTVNEDPALLEKAISSYENQVGVRTQIIISTISGDPSLAIAINHGLEVSISPQKGIYEQLNYATKFIKGAWFCYASGNDAAEPYKCRMEIQHCYETNKLVCYSAFKVADNSLKVYSSRKFHQYDYKKHLAGNFVSDCAMIKTDLLMKFLPFNNQVYGNHAYWDLWLRIYEKFGNLFCYLDHPTWIYRQEDKSAHLQRKGNKEKTKLNIDLRIKLQKDHAEIAKKLPLKYRV